MVNKPESSTSPGHGDSLLEAMPVATAWRVALGFLGIALISISCFAVLTADNELGTTALAVIGVTVLIVSALGHWPARLVWGDKVAEWGALRVQRALESGAESQEVAQVASDVARTPLEHLLAFQLQNESRGGRFESAAIERLAESAQILGCDLLRREAADVWDARLAKGSADQALEVPLSRSVVVLCSKYRPTGDGKTLSLMARLQVISMRGDDVPAAVLVITEYDADREGADFLSTAFGIDVSVPVLVAKLDGPEFNETMRRAVELLPS